MQEPPTDEYNRLLRSLKETQEALDQATLASVPASQLLELLSRNAIARKAVDTYRKLRGR